MRGNDISFTLPVSFCSRESLTIVEIHMEHLIKHTALLLRYHV